MSDPTPAPDDEAPGQALEVSKRKSLTTYSFWRKPETQATLKFGTLFGLPVLISLIVFPSPINPVLISAAVVAAVYGVHKAYVELRDDRAASQWQAVKDDVVRTEKVEQLGHTMGGLSEASDAKAGQLSEAADP